MERDFLDDLEGWYGMVWDGDGRVFRNALKWDWEGHVRGWLVATLPERRLGKRVGMPLERSKRSSENDY